MHDYKMACVTVNRNRAIVMKLSPLQSRMARAAIGLGVRDLAKRLGMSPDTIARLERGEDLKESTLATIRAALEQAGVIFVEADGEAGPGVRLKDRDAR